MDNSDIIFHELTRAAIAIISVYGVIWGISLAWGIFKNRELIAKELKPKAKLDFGGYFVIGIVILFIVTHLK